MPSPCRQVSRSACASRGNAPGSWPVSPNAPKSASTRSASPGSTRNPASRAGASTASRSSSRFRGPSSTGAARAGRRGASPMHGSTRSARTASSTSAGPACASAVATADRSAADAPRVNSSSNWSTTITSLPAPRHQRPNSVGELRIAPASARSSTPTTGASAAANAPTGSGPGVHTTCGHADSRGLPGGQRLPHARPQHRGLAGTGGPDQHDRLTAVELLGEPHQQVGDHLVAAVEPRGVGRLEAAQPGVRARHRRSGCRRVAARPWPGRSRRSGRPGPGRSRRWPRAARRRAR